MKRAIPPKPRPSASIAAFLALGLGAIAACLAVFYVFSSALAALPFSPILLILGLGTLAAGLREYSMRVQLKLQADIHTASLRELENQIRWLNMTEAHAKVGHWWLDLATDEVFWSDATFAVHGLKSGTPPMLEGAIDFYHADDKASVEENINQARQTGEFRTFKARLIGADGELRHVDCGASVECAADGTPIALFGVIKDRTEEENMQQDLREARDKARALAQSKGQFLARMSHEIRTPMNGVLGFAELLGRTELQVEQKRHADLIIESGKTLQTLLNDILDLSKIEAGKIEVNSGTLDISHLTYRVTQMAEPGAREKGINLVYDTAPDVPRYVVADALRLRQILSNLLSNAIRFTDDGGISLSVHCDNGKLCFSICDTGTGIDAQMQERIFDPFTQARTDTEVSRGGTGLGLAISRQLAELMGGQLTVRSQINEGSVFTLSLPLIGATAPPVNPKDERLGPIFSDQSPSRVLLAEDYDINRELIADMTHQLGLEIECAEDGLEAVTMIHHARSIGQPFALVLMDLQMPRLDGLEATQRLRNNGIDEDELPIVALTANAYADDVENCLAAGMQAHLAKPITMQRLSAALQKWLPQDATVQPDAGSRERIEPL